MMRRTAHHAKPQMTKAGNRLAFQLLLAGCTDERLSTLDSTSLGRSYGLPPDDVRTALALEMDKRRVHHRVQG